MFFPFPFLPLYALGGFLYIYGITDHDAKIYATCILGSLYLYILFTPFPSCGNQ